MRNIYLIGASGCPNYGDDLIASTWARFIQGRRPTAKILVEGVDTEASSSFLCLQNQQAFPVKNIWHTNSETSEEKTAEGCLAEGLGFTDKSFFTEEKYAVAREIFQSSDIIHLHGGGYINSMWPGSSYVVGAVVSLKRKYGMKIFATGLGIQPLDTAYAPKLAEVFSEFDLVEFRDKQSYETIMETGLCRGAIFGLDDMFLVKPRAKDIPDRVLHICIQKDISEDEIRASFLDRVKTFIRKHGKLFSEIRYYIFSPGSDEQAFEELAQEPDAKIRKVSYVELASEGISAGPNDFGLASRFHAHLLLAQRGVRGIFCSQKQDYYNVKHNSLLSLGSPWISFDPDRKITLNFSRKHQTFSPNEFARKIETASILYPR